MTRIDIALALALAAALGGAPLAALAGGEHTHEHAHGHDAHAKNTASAPREQTEWGIAADPKAARRVIRVTMSDTMRFSPDTIEVKQGETVKFIVHNAGKMQHEMVLGTRSALQEHAALMKKFPGMEHDEAHMAHVAPGRTATLAWTFNRPGLFQFACLVPGHYEAGMAGRIRAGTGQPQESSAAAAAARKP